MAKSQVAATKAATITVSTDVPMPTFKRTNSRGSLYPFEKLTAVGHSFHIPETEENPDPVGRVRSSLSNARDEWAEVILGEDGEPIMVERNTRSGKNLYPKKRLTRDFKVVAVGEEDPDGKGARVFRTL